MSVNNKNLREIRTMSGILVPGAFTSERKENSLFLITRPGSQYEILKNSKYEHLKDLKWQVVDVVAGLLSEAACDTSKIIIGSFAVREKSGGVRTASDLDSSSGGTINPRTMEDLHA